jgi:ATP-binding cassette subfamily C (CFTR/MRP) protein 4
MPMSLNSRVTAEESRAFYADLHEHETNGTNKSATIMDESKILPVEQYVYIYTLIVVAVFVLGITRSFAFYKVCMRCSQRLHDLVFEALIRASMRFFDTNPSGRILNRFSKDMGAIDELLPKAILDSAQIILMMFGSLIVVSIINPIFLVPIVLIASIFYWIRKVYLKTSKNIKRLEGMSK